MKNYTHQLSLACLVAVLALTGCVDPVTSDLESPIVKSSAVEYIPIVTPTEVRNELKTYSKADRMQLKSQSVDAAFAASRVLKSDASDFAIYLELTRIMEENVDNPYLYKIEQVLASSYLRKVLVQANGEIDIESVASATEILLRNAHQDAGVMGPAIESLVGHWPADQISEAASRTIENANLNLAKFEATASKQDCTECSGVKQILTDEQLGAEAVFVVANRNAIDRLHSLVL